MFYQVECETLEGEFIFANAPTLAAAKRKASRLSCDHMLAYAVAYDDNGAVGHVAYSDGVKCGTEGVLR